MLEEYDLYSAHHKSGVLGFGTDVMKWFTLTFEDADELMILSAI